MKTITDEIQAILDADQNFPVTTVVITLNDGTVLRLADRPVTIGGDDYDGDLTDPPRLVVDDEKGIDHTELVLNNADWQFSAYDNQDLFDGARVVVSQYFAIDGSYESFEGPVVSFTGVISQPTTSGAGVINLIVLADGRISEEGTIGRTITGRCMNTFRDANCGYQYSGTIAISGTYNAGTSVALSETAVTGQLGSGFVALQPSPLRSNRVMITRSGTPIYGVAQDLFIASADFAIPGDEAVRFNIQVTVQTGDKIEYVTCPRDSMFNCGRRWRIGSASRQQDKWMGLDYLRGGTDFFQVTDARFDDAIGQIVPIAYGHRWVDPLFIGIHQKRPANGDPAWNSDRKGPFVVALLSEGEVDQGIVTPDTDIELDGKLAKDTADYASGVSAALDVKVGTSGQAVSDFAPTPIAAISSIPALSAMPNVAYAILDLPDNYDVSTETVEYATGPNDASLPKRLLHQPKRPALRLKVKGRKVFTWSFVGSTPTKAGARVFSNNPIWLLLDLLTSPYREAPSDAWSAGVSEADLDIASFITWATYANESISVFDANGNAVTVSRFLSSLYHTTPDRRAAIQALLDAARASLVFRNGKTGVVCDAPLGGKGQATSGSTSSLTDSRRTDSAYPAVPSFPTGGLNGALAGLKVEIYEGTGAGQVRTIESNTADTVVPTVDFLVAPNATSKYAIYAVKITKDNCNNVKRTKGVASHAVPNRLVVQFEAEEFRGRSASIPIIDSVEDDQGNTHLDRFGPVESQLSLPAVTSYQQAVRHGWYELRKGLDTNRLFEIEDVNIEGMPIEVGDIILFSHDIDGVANEVLRVERFENLGDATYKVTARLYREHIHADWPTDDFQGLDISSNLINPHSVPPHVANTVVEPERETADSPPLMVVTYDLPQWPYAGWSVLIEARYRDAEENWTDWKLMATSRDASASFRAARLADYEIRAVFISHSGVRADADVVSGTSSGSNSGTTLNDTSKHWTPNQYTGLTAAIVGGTGDGQERTIASNTDTQAVVPGWDDTPDASSQYKFYSPADVVPVLVEPVEASTGIRIIKLPSDETRIRFKIEYGEDVIHVALWSREYEQSTLRDRSELTREDFNRLTEPDDDAVDWDEMLFPDDPDDEILEFPVPPEERERWITLRPVSIGGRKGSGYHFPIYPTGEAADRVVSVQLQVNSVTGAVEIPLLIDPRSSSVRAAYAVGPVGVTAPTDQDVEASGGTIGGQGFVTNIVGSDVLALPANTVGYDQEIVVRICAYLGEDGYDDKGRTTVHGEIKEVRALRQKPPVSLDLEVDDSDPDTGEATVTLRDKAGFVTAIKARRKVGDADWSAPFNVTTSPEDGQSYIVTVTKVERHQSSLDIWAEGSINGAPFRVAVEVPAFDAGRIPNVIIIPKLDEEAATGTASIVGDSDTDSTKIVAARNTPPSDDTLNGATPINGRMVLYTDVGTLVSGLVPGDIVHYAWRGIGPNGEIQSAIYRCSVPYHVIAPTLDPTTTDEDQDAAVATFGVTVRDSAAQADTLEFQTRFQGDAWPSSWTTKSSSPSDGVEYTETVDLVEGHGSQIRFRLKFTIRNKVREVILESPVFDPGKIPRGQVRPILDEDLNVTADVVTNFDCRSIKIVAAVGSVPSDATVRAATAINVPIGQAGVYSDTIGTLLMAAASDNIYIKVFFYSEEDGDGNESPEPVVAFIQAATVAATNPRIISCWTGGSITDTGSELDFYMTWEVAEAPPASYIFDLVVVANGVEVDVLENVPLDTPQIYSVLTAGGTGTSGIPVVVRFMLKRISDSVYVYTKDTPPVLTVNP